MEPVSAQRQTCMMSVVTAPGYDPAADLADDAGRLLDEIARDMPETASAAADCRPPLDVVETATSVEVIVDVPGLSAASLRVAMRHSTLLIVGSKLSAPFEPRAHYHLAERSYGRFARAVRLKGAFDLGRARAVVASGQLRVVLPLIEERRGRLLTIQVEPS
jgi:HSP20 family protein